MEINPDELDTAERYKLLIGCIVPRPIAFVSTISPDNRTNLAPFPLLHRHGPAPPPPPSLPAPRPHLGPARTSSDSVHTR